MNLLRPCALFLALVLGLVTQAQAGTILLAGDNQWNEFSVDDFSSASQGVEWIETTDSTSAEFGLPLIYKLTIASGFKGLLSVVDAGFAGDRFELFSNGFSLGLTSDTWDSLDYSNDFNTNLSNSHFSNETFVFTEGTYHVTGMLFSTLQSFNSTNGAIKLHITPVPSPGTLGLLLIGLSLLTIMRRRRV